MGEQPQAAVAVDAGAAACLPTLAGLPVVLTTADPLPLTDAVARALTWGLPLVIDLDAPEMVVAPTPKVLAGALRALARASGVVPIVGVRTTPDPVPAPATVTTVAALADVVTASAAQASQVLGFLPPNALTDPPQAAALAPTVPADVLDGLVPGVADLPYDVTVALDAVLDPQAVPLGDRDRPLRTLLARAEGAPVGVVAVDAARRQGMPTAQDARAAARFVGWCDAFGLPVLTLLDVPDALDPLPDTDPAAAAALAAAYGSATSGLVTVVVRRAHGLTAALLGLPCCGADVTLAWPGADVEALGPGVVVLDRPADTRAEVVAALSLARRRRDTPAPRRHAVPPR